MGNSACKDCSYANQQSIFRKTCLKKEEVTEQDKEINIQQIQISDLNGNKSTEKQLTKAVSKGKLDKFGSLNIKQLSMLDKDKGIEDTDNSFLPLQSKLEQTLQKKTSNDGYDSYQNNPQRFSQISEPIPVPYSVIRLLIKKQISSQLINHDKQFYTQLQDTNSELYRAWKMQKQGYYTNKKSDGTSIIITDRLFYKGWTKISTFIPQDAGVLVTHTGIYDGNFLNGKAHGKGTFIRADEKTKYIGTWESGKFVKGKVEGLNYKYEGPLRNNKPHGSGILSFNINKNEYKYIGNFENGKFQGKGQYQSPDHIYIGNFKAGKKQGEGTLQKINSDRTKTKNGQNKQKYVKFKGFWIQDQLQSIKDNE